MKRISKALTMTHDACHVEIALHLEGHTSQKGVWIGQQLTYYCACRIWLNWIIYLLP